MATVRIERRFRGPPSTANGGYVAGLVAAALGGSNCTVTLKAPPPLGRDLTLATEDSLATLIENDSIVVSATREPVEVDVPPPPSFDDALEAQPRFPGLVHHDFPGCFVCGPERGAGDGLRIFPGPLGTQPGRSRRPGVRTRRSPTKPGWFAPSSCGRRSIAPAISPRWTRPAWPCSGGCRRPSTGRSAPASR